MKTAVIVYFSGTGHTARLAEAVRQGVLEVADIAARLLPIDPARITEGRLQDAALLDEITRADAVIFGTPTYMGGVAAQFKAFVDASSGHWYRRQWKDKLAAGFTHSGSPSGDKLNTLFSLAVFAAQHGMIWIGNSDLTGSGGPNVNRVGSYLGVMGYGNGAPDAAPALDAGDLATAAALGRRVAEVALRFDRQPEPVLVS
jgi:NAD(P)H dehydrogenase (quinone)